MTDAQLPDATLLRYLDGASEPVETARVEHWLAADPSNRAELERLRVLWNRPPLAELDVDDRTWKWIAKRMDAPVPRPKLLGYQAGRPFSSARRWGSIAAALAIGAAGTLLFQLAERATPSRNDAPAASATRTLATARGERAIGHLPDGSRVVLGPDSRLETPVGFGGRDGRPGAREVRLQGEAFFEVTHDSTRPFRVLTANGVAEDLGTEFVVTAYPETRITRVVVASGAVALRRAETRPDSGAGAPPVVLALEAGDLGRIDEAGGLSLTRNVDVARYVGWTEGRLAFAGVALGEAIPQLARWYDIEIRLADPALAQQRLTVTFRDEPMAQVLRVLEIALGVRADQAGRIVTLSPSLSP